MSVNMVSNPRSAVLYSRWPITVIVLICLLAGVVAAAVAAARLADGRDQVAATPTTPVVKKIHALGRLEPRGTVLRISAPSGNEGARIEQMLVEEGQSVQPDDLLAVLDVADRREAAVVEAEARWHAAQAKLDQVRAGAKPGEIDAQSAMVERMDAELELARKELERARQLIAKQVLAPESLDQKQFTYDRAVLETRRAKAMLDSLREVRDVDVRLQEREVAAAAAGLRRARADLDAAQVRSNAVGKVLKIHTHAGERIGDQGVLQLGDVARMQAVAEVFEGDVQQIRIGQPAEVAVSSSGIKLTGRVEQIGLMVARKDVLSNDPVSDTDARVLEVRIELDAAMIPQVERLSNARVEVTILLEDGSTASP